MFVCMIDCRRDYNSDTRQRYALQPRFQSLVFLPLDIVLSLLYTTNFPPLDPRQKSLGIFHTLLVTPLESTHPTAIVWIRDTYR